MFRKTRKKIKQLSYQHPQATNSFEGYLRGLSTGAYWLRFLINSFFLLKNKDHSYLDAERRNYTNRLLAFNHKHIVILGHEHVAILIQSIQEKLHAAGITSEVITAPPKEGFSEALHIVICPQAFHALPRTYIAFQMEQLAISSRYRQQRYLDILNNALAVMDYSLLNCEYMIQHGVSSERVFYVPIFCRVNNEKNSNLEYDVLFYGDIHSKRRQQLLKQIAEDFNLKIAFKVWGEQKFEELSKAKIIVNLHYYENALLESTRIFECLNLGKVIISETSTDQTCYDHLNGIVEFAEAGDYPQLKEKISQLLQNTHLQKRMADIQNKLNAQPDWFALYFYRVLLALDLIDFETFYRLIGKEIQISQNSLVRTIELEPISHENSSLVNNGLTVEALRHYQPHIAEKLTLELIRRNSQLTEIDSTNICLSDPTKSSWSK